MAKKFTFDTFKDKIDLINSGIGNVLSGEPKNLYGAARHLFTKGTGGKRLRPVLCLLCCEAVGGRAEDALPTAISTELIHTFTLIHDDMMDDDKLRRGVDSVHVAYGKTTAVLAGDLLFAKSFEICDEMAAKIMAHAASEICEGQELDMSYEKRNFVSGEEYMKMIQKKTASLIEASTMSGAVLGNASGDEVEKMAKYGRSIGLAFQIHDDLLDLTGDEEKIGKPVVSDIVEGKKTLIVVKALEFLDENKKEDLLEILNKKNNSDSDIKKALKLINSCGAIDYCKTIEKELIEDSRHALAQFPDSGAKQDLLDIAGFIIRRDL